MKAETISQIQKDVDNLVKKFGIDLKVTVAMGGYGPDLDAAAPDGKRFVSSGCHTIVSSAWDGDKVVEVWRDMRSQLEYGVEDCPQDCDCKEAR